MKRTLSVILAIVLMLPTIFCVSASAASYPKDISSSRYIEFKAQQKINVYKDKTCKTRGTATPSKKYDAYISKNDVCYIYEIAASYIKVNYPASGERRTGFIKRSDLFDKTAPEEYISSAKDSVTVYKAEGSSSIAKGDEVWRVDPKNGYTGYRAVIYEAKSGKRAYKMGYITLDDLDKVKNGAKDGETGEKPVSRTDKLEAVSMTSVLYNLSASSSKLTCGFDGYKTTSGRHEGIDFKNENSADVFSLTNGIVTNVVEGKNGVKKNGGALSTIAIYDETNNKTVVYLHSNPVDTLKVGQKISKGDKIATEAWRGCSTSKKGHTHVEVREGRKTGAAKSTDDYTLDNKNPKSYWQSLGYEVR